MWEKVLISFVLGILQYLMGRKDLRDAAKAEVYRELHQKAMEVYEWEASAAAHPTGGADLRVQPGAGRIRLESEDADPPRGTDNTQVPGK